MRTLIVTILAMLGALSAGAVCNAGFTLSQTGNSVSVTNTSTYSPTGPNINGYCTLYWGDGYGTGIGYGSTANHTYNSPGTYNLYLIQYVYDSLAGTSCIDSFNQQITIAPPPCYSTISITGSSPSYTFTANNSTPGATFTWFFGDGTNASGSPVSHTYGSAGFYTVVLVTQAGGCIDSSYQTIQVGFNCSMAQASFNVSSNNGHMVNFVNTSTLAPAGMTRGCLWLFGDGTTAYTTNNAIPGISHYYYSAGTYNVRLVVTWTGQGISCTDTSNVGQVTITLPLCSSSISVSSFSGGPTRTFTANNLSGQTGSVTYNWSFGDGSTGTGTPITHTYPGPGLYNVTLISTSTGCVDSSHVYVSVDTPLNCSTANASFNVYYGQGGTVSFQNTSSPLTVSSGIVSSSWSFGDGTGSVQQNVSHTYSTTGSYTVKLVMTWNDTLNQTVCVDSASQIVNISAVNNQIAGTIYADSLNPTQVDTFKVWLIKFDSTSQMLYAVDSQLVAGALYANYTFYGKPAGQYRTKAAQINGPSSGTGMLPTYHLNSLYWNTANVIYHYGGATLYKHIIMQTGTVTGGPGFIGGDVTQGANKGTADGDPVPNVLVFLRDASNKVVRMTYTNAAGQYSFSNVPTGNYSVYPEAMNYVTTPYTSVVVSAAQPTANGIKFKQTEDMEIKPRTTAAAHIGQPALVSNIYPNPASDVVKVALASDVLLLHVKVIGLTGITAGSYEFRSVRKGQVLSLPVQDLVPGMYLIRLSDGSQEWSEKVRIK